jgi:ribosomal protein S18 acetylase RimI-like enzyme
LSETISIGPIAADELEAAVRIFFAGFGPGVRRLYGERPRPDAMVDVWGFAREVEPGGFFAAREGGRLAGYALFTSSVSALQRRAVASGRIFVWALRAIFGRYGLVWSAVLDQLRNKLLFVGSSSSFRTSGDAQLLNIAVATEARGHGVATELVRAGLHYLRSRGVHEVRLEVQPGNTAAIAAYRTAGFAERGRLHNVDGEWIVMTADPAATQAAG